MQESNFISSVSVKLKGVVVAHHVLIILMELFNGMACVNPDQVTERFVVSRVWRILFIDMSPDMKREGVLNFV